MNLCRDAVGMDKRRAGFAKPLGDLHHYARTLIESPQPAERGERADTPPFVAPASAKGRVFRSRKHGFDVMRWQTRREHGHDDFRAATLPRRSHQRHTAP